LQYRFGSKKIGAFILLWSVISCLLFLVLMIGLGDAQLISVSSPPSLSRILRLTFNTIIMSSTAGFLATGFGLLSVYCVQFLHKKLRGTVLALSVLPIFVAPPVMAVAAIRLLGPSGWLAKFLTSGEATFPVVERVRSQAPTLPAAPIYSLWGGGLTLAWLLFPLSVLLIYRAFELIPNDVRAAAKLETNSRFKSFLKIDLPYLWPSLFVSFCIVTFFSMVEFGIPESLRSLPVLISEVYVQAGVFFDLRSATIAGFALIIVAALLLIPIIKMIDRTVEGDGLDHSTETSHKGNNVLFFVPLIPGILLILILFVTANGPQGRLEVWHTALTTSHEEILKSVLLSLSVLPFVLIVGFLLGVSLYQSSWRFFSRVLILVPFLTPSPLLALAMQQTLRLPARYDVPVLDDFFYNVSQTHAPLIFVWVLRFAPLVALFVDSFLRQQITKETHEMMILENHHPFKKITMVFLPLSMQSLVISGLIVFGLCIGEVGAAVLLMPPGITNLSIRLLTQMHYAPTGQISALSLLMIIPGLMVLLLINFFSSYGTKSSE